MDGSEIDSFLPTSYTYRTHPSEVNKIWQNRVQVQDLDAFLLPFGYGDGGGGPARDFIESAKRQEDLEGSVKVKMAGPLEFFHDMEAQAARQILMLENCISVPTEEHIPLRRW